MSYQCESAEQRIEFQKLVNGRRDSRFTVSPEVAAAVEQLLREKGSEHKYHGNCRAVMICGEINEEVYAECVNNHGATPIEDRRWFSSARAASLHFGLNPDAVSIALKRANDRGQDTAILAGVPVCWADKLGGN